MAEQLVARRVAMMGDRKAEKMADKKVVLKVVMKVVKKEHRLAC